MREEQDVTPQSLVLPKFMAEDRPDPGQPWAAFLLSAPGDWTGKGQRLTTDKQAQRGGGVEPIFYTIPSWSPLEPGPQPRIPPTASHSAHVQARAAAPPGN